MLKPPHRPRSRRAVAACVASAALTTVSARAAVLSPTQVRTAYGISSLTLDGAGQTIAIIDTDNDPTIRTDLSTFDGTYGVKDSAYGFDPANPSSFAITGVNGGSLPATNVSGGETALDVEWAHAIAPAAKILLVETGGGLAAAAQYAATVPGVAVVTVSYGSAEYAGETAYDKYYAQPANHTGVSFFYSSGDSSNVSYAATSPNVIAVGATNLTLTGGAYGGEVAWSDTAGGVSKYEKVPAYQTAVAAAVASETGVAVTGRMTPDVSILGGSGSPVHTVIAGGYYDSWGTSLSSPVWAAIVALADEGRVDNGLTPLSTQQTLTMLYALYGTPYYAMGFNDVTSGTNANGTSALPGYDELTGLGTPKAGWLVPYLDGSIAIPEPSTAAVLAAVVGLGTVGRRRRRS